MDKKTTAHRYKYNMESCPSCVKNAIEEELREMGKTATGEELAEIKRWETKHRYLKILAFVVFVCLFAYIFANRV